MDGIIRENIAANESRPIPGVRVMLRNLETGKTSQAITSGEGQFRMLLLSPGHYEFQAEAENYAAFRMPDLLFNADEVVTLEIALVSTAGPSLLSRLPRRIPL